MFQDRQLNKPDFGLRDRIDQLVCGSLRGAAYREALQWLDANPHYWRDCALAFLQEQAIEQELQAMAHESLDCHRSLKTCSTKGLTRDLPNSIATAKPKPENGQPDSMESTILHGPAQSVASGNGMQQSFLGHLASNSQVSSKARFAPAAKLLGVAALLLLSFGVGWMTSGYDNRATLDSRSLLSHSDPMAKDSLGNPEHHLADSRTQSGGLTGWDAESNYDQTYAKSANSSNGRNGMRNVNTTDSDSHYSWAISDSMLRNNPDLVGNLSRRLLPIDQEIPRELLELERLGRVRIETSSSLMPIDQENGTVLVPVQQYQIVPVVFSY